MVLPQTSPEDDSNINEEEQQETAGKFEDQQKYFIQITNY